MDEEFLGLNTQHKVAQGGSLLRGVEICCLENQHLLNILNKHVRNVQNALNKEFSSTTFKDCAYICNFTKYIAPYVQELLVRSLWKECQYALENAYKRKDRVVCTYKNTKEILFTQEHLKPYQERASDLYWSDSEEFDIYDIYGPDD
jgi:hypothetical protein